jgi:hypothetical protein
VEASTWEFVLMVPGFETEQEAACWADGHRETLVDETLLKLPDRFAKRATGIDEWRKQVLTKEKLNDWTVKLAADGHCWRETKVLQINRDTQSNPSGFLHEVAHALCPEPEGPMKNHYHGGQWATEYGRLVDKYLTHKM